MANTAWMTPSALDTVRSERGNKIADKDLVGFLRVFTAVNRHHDQGNSYKKQHLIRAGLQVQKLSPLSSRWEQGSIQTGMVQEELRVLHLNLKAVSRILTSRQLK